MGRPDAEGGGPTVAPGVRLRRSVRSPGASPKWGKRRAEEAPDAALRPPERESYKRFPHNELSAGQDAGLPGV